MSQNVILGAVSRKGGKPSLQLKEAEISNLVPLFSAHLIFHNNRPSVQNHIPSHRVSNLEASMPENGNTRTSISTFLNQGVEF